MHWVEIHAGSGSKDSENPRALESGFFGEANENSGEYRLHVGCARWAFGIDRSGETRVITDSNADCSPNGPMVAGLETLIGNSVKVVTVDALTFDLNMYFEQGDLRLKVYGEISEDEDGYNLVMPGRVIVIDGPGRIRSEIRKA